MSKKQSPILYSNLLYKMGHYFLDTQYKYHEIVRTFFLDVDSS